MSSLISLFTNILKRNDWSINRNHLSEQYWYYWGNCYVESDNQHDDHAVAVVGHAHRMLSKLLMMFLKLPGSRVLSMVNGEPVNRSGGDGLVIPVGATLEGHTKAIAWAKKKIQTLHKVHNDRIKRYKAILHCVAPNSNKFCDILRNTNSVFRSFRQFRKVSV